MILCIFIPRYDTMISGKWQLCSKYKPLTQTMTQKQHSEVPAHERFPSGKSQLLGPVPENVSSQKSDNLDTRGMFLETLETNQGMDKFFTCIPNVMVLLHASSKS